MLSGSLVALVTPMLENGDIDYAALEYLLQRHINAGTDGVVLCGSTGEGSSLSAEERVAYVKRALEIVQGEMPIIVGVGTNATRPTVSAAQAISDLGVDALLTICPYYNKPTQEGLYQHFQALSQADTAPVIVYNHPGRTGVDLLPKTAARIAQLPNIIGLKEAVTDPARFTALRAECPEDFLLFSGDDETSVAFVAAGGDGVISVAANIVPEAMRLMMHAALNGDHARAISITHELHELFQAMGVETNPIPVKWAMAQMGWIQDSLRLPLTSLSAASQPQVRAALEILDLVDAGEMCA